MKWESQPSVGSSRLLTMTQALSRVTPDQRAKRGASFALPPLPIAAQLIPRRHTDKEYSLPSPMSSVKASLWLRAKGRNLLKTVFTSNYFQRHSQAHRPAAALSHYFTHAGLKTCTAGLEVIVSALKRLVGRPAPLHSAASVGFLLIPYPEGKSMTAPVLM